MDTSKLPKWASEHIRVLEMRLGKAEAALKQLKNNERTHIEVHEGIDPAWYLPEHSSVRFVPDFARPLTSIEVGLRYLNESNRTTVIDVSAGSGRLLVYPKASNVIEVISEY